MNSQDRLDQIKDPGDVELLIHLAEFDALQREHELLQKMRQELGVYTLAAAVALIGAFFGQATLFTNAQFTRIFLVLPFFFSLMTWWYIRTNYSAALLERYVLTHLRPKLSDLAKAQVLNWIPFLYEVELSPKGKVVLLLQTISRVGLIQGPAVLSVIVFWLRAGPVTQWGLIDWLLFVTNVALFIISGVLAWLTAQIIRSLKLGAIV